MGLVSGLGAATADAFYGALAAFGLTAAGVSALRGRFSPRAIGAVNTVSGALLVAFGFAAIVTALTALR